MARPTPVSRRTRFTPHGRFVALAMTLVILLTSVEGIAQAEAQRQISKRDQPSGYIPREPNIVEREPLNQVPPPTTYSGASATYPLNHTFDAYPQVLNDGPTNWDIEATPQVVGTPPADYTFETTPTDTDLPTNYGFGTGDFTGWTTANGTFTIGTTGGPSGNFAQVPSTSSATLTTAAFSVSTSADIFQFDYGRVSAGSTSFAVAVLSGGSYTTVTSLGNLTCNTSCTWAVQTWAATDWRGSSIKLRFTRSGGSFSIDNVRTVDLVNGWDLQGNPRLETHDSSTWLVGTTNIVSPAFTVDSATQYGTFKVKKISSGADPQREVFVLSGGSYATSTKIGYFAVDGTVTYRIPLYAWQGQSIKIRIGNSSIGTIAVDNVLIQTVPLPGWTLTNPDYNRVLDNEIGQGLDVAAGPPGADGYDPGQALALTQYDDMESAAFTVSAGAQFLILMHQDGYSGVGVAGVNIRVLSGPTFTTVTNITTSTLASPSSDWGRFAFPIASFQGQTIKLRIIAAYRIYLNDIGFEGSIAPGWDPLAGSDAFTVLYDTVNGTYLTPNIVGDDFVIGSSPVSAGVVAGGSRSYSLGYAFGPYSASRMRVWWIPTIAGVPQTAVSLYDESAGSTTNTDYQDARFTLEATDLPLDGSDRVQTGYFKIQGERSVQLFQIADNIARQQLGEPFSMRAGLGVDASTGSFGWAENDITLEGGPLPLVLSRYYSGHSDRLGALGYRWRHSFDTQLYIGAGQEHMAVLFADGREEAFLWDGVDEWLPTDARVHSTLTEPTSGIYEYTTIQGLRLRFNSLGLLIYVIDRNDNEIEFAYNGSDQLESATTLGSRTLEFFYTGDNLTSVSGPDGLEITYTYNGKGDLVSVEKPDDQLSEYTYSRHRLTEVRQFVQLDPEDEGQIVSIVKNKLDDFNRVTKQTFPDATELQFGYQYDFVEDDPYDGITSVRDRSENGITRYYFDHFGRTEYVVTPEDMVNQFMFDSDGNLETWVDGAGAEYGFGYNSTGAVTSITDPLANIVNITVNPQHLPTIAEDPYGVITKNTYDGDGNLTRRIVDFGTDPENLNLTTDYEYDPTTGLMITMILDPDDGVGDPELNLVTEWTYHADGNIATKTIDPDDGVGDAELDLTWEYAYNNRGQLVVELDPSGLRKRYEYTTFGRIEQVIVDPERDPNLAPYDLGEGVTALDLKSRYVFDFGGKLVITADPWCQEHEFDLRECQSEWGYNELGLVTEKYDTMDVRTGYEYNDNGQMSAVIQDATMPTPIGTELNLRTEYEYDNDGRLTRVIVDPTVPGGPEELNLVSAYEYDTAGRLWKEIVDPDGLNLITEYDYDAKGRLEHKFLPGDPSPTWTYEYDDNDRLIRTIDPESRITENVYDRAGRLSATIVDPDNGTGPAELDLTTQYEYDDASRLIRTVAPDGLVTETVYDKASRAIQTIIDPGGEELVTENIYNPNGSLWKTIDPLGHVTERLYDRAGRLDTLIAPGGRETTYEYDENSRLIQETGPTGVVTQYQYDLMGRRTHTIVDPGNLALTTVVAYDRLGRQKTVTNPRGKVTSFDYDAAGRLLKITDAGSPAGELTFTYDAAGRTESVTTPEGSVTWYTYNESGQPTLVENAKGAGIEQDWSKTYYLDGSLETATDPNGNELTYLYDGAGRLEQVNLTGEGSVVAYTYDEAGRTDTITNYTGVIAYQYDDLGRIETVTDRGQTVGYTWNEIGQRLSMTLPGSRTVTYDYDETTADLEAITDFSNAPGPTLYSYRADGRLETISRPTSTDPILSEYGYDTAGRLTGISHSQDSVYLAEYGYTLDDNGNREQVVITGSEVITGTETYVYDNLDRLISASYPGPITASFDYDKNGNRTEVQSAGITTTYAYDELGQLTDITDNDSLDPLDLTITYDLNGNRDQVIDNNIAPPNVLRDYAWDYANRLTVAEVNSVSTEYEYLGDNTRASLDDGTQTDFLYDRLGGLPQVIDDGEAAYLHDVTGNSTSIDGTTDDATYPLSDALGSVRLVTDDEGAKIGDTNWDAWGNEQNTSGAQYEFGWTGQQYDEASDLTYLRARYYSPGTATFLSRDTVQPNAPGSGGYNPYSYANGNPTTFTDPSGHMMTRDQFGGSGVSGPLLYLAYVMECAMSGVCRYRQEHASISLETVGARVGTCSAVAVTRRAVGALAKVGELIAQLFCPSIGGIRAGAADAEPQRFTDDGDGITNPDKLDELNEGCSDSPARNGSFNLLGAGPTGTYIRGEFGIETPFTTALLDECRAWNWLEMAIKYEDPKSLGDIVIGVVGEFCPFHGCGIFLDSFNPFFEFDASELATRIARSLRDGGVDNGVAVVLVGPMAEIGVAPEVYSQNTFFAPYDGGFEPINPCDWTTENNSTIVNIIGGCTWPPR